MSGDARTATGGAAATPGTAAARHFGKHRGVVTDNEDPKGMGRLKALVPGLLADVETGWALPCVPYAGDGVGFVAVPPPGAGVWVEFEAGDLSRPVWTGCWWGEGQVPDGATPAQKVWKSEKGHTVLLDDEGGKVEVLDESGNHVVLDADGILAEDANGNAATMDASGVKVEDANGNSVTMSSSGVEVKDANGGSIKMESSGIEVSASGKKVKLGASGVSVNDGALEVM